MLLMLRSCSLLGATCTFDMVYVIAVVDDVVVVVAFVKL